MLTIHTPPRRDLLVAVAVALAVAGCGADPSPSSDEGEPTAAEVEIQGFAFSPGELTVPVGTTVTFVNNDGAPHTVTHGTDGTAAEDAAFDEQVSGGQEVTITFDEAGTFPITCTIHPSMNMTVTVEG